MMMNHQRWFFQETILEIVLGTLACYARLTIVIVTLIYIRVGAVSLTDNKLIYHDRIRTRDFGIAHFTYEFQ